MQEELCDFIAYSFLVLIGVQWLLAVLLRPFIAPFETFFHVLLSSLIFVSAVLMVVEEARGRRVFGAVVS
jgi:hypothetical protein